MKLSSLIKEYDALHKSYNRSQEVLADLLQKEDSAIGKREQAEIRSEIKWRESSHELFESRLNKLSEKIQMAEQAERLGMKL